MNIADVEKVALALAIGIAASALPILGQTKSLKESKSRKWCLQPPEVRERLIKKAESEKYVIRRIEITGNIYLRDRTFRERIAASLNEGDIFNKKVLKKGARDISKIRAIYPITLADVELRLDEQNKDIDFIFCVQEKQQKKLK
jgi:hypothetical protein